LNLDKRCPSGHNQAVQQALKPLRWIDPAKKDLLAMPESAQQTSGFALYQAQIGLKDPATKPLKG